MIVRERRREIGVLKAIGSSNARISLAVRVRGAHAHRHGRGRRGDRRRDPQQPRARRAGLEQLEPGETARRSPPAPGGPAGCRRRRSDPHRRWARAAGVTQFGDVLSNVQAHVGFSILLYGLLAAVLIAVIGTAFPSWLIAKIRPAEVMRRSSHAAGHRSLEDVRFRRHRGEGRRRREPSRCRPACSPPSSGAAAAARARCSRCWARSTSRRAGASRSTARSSAGGSDHQLIQYRRNQIGFVFQSYNLIPNLTAVQNVMLPMEFAGVSNRERRDRAVAAARTGRAQGRQATAAPGEALGWRAAARRHRPGVVEPTQAHPRRRAHRQPRHQAPGA